MRLGRGLCAVFLAGVFALATGAPVETAEPRSDAALSFTEQTLYSFCSQSGCTDGRNPYAGLIVDGSGNLYGTTVQGGARNSGTVFQLTPTGTGWSEQVLYSFCSQTDCTDGATPYGGLIMDESGDDGAGNLYATTSSGGVVLSCCGTVFQLTPTGTGMERAGPLPLLLAEQLHRWPLSLWRPDHGRVG